MSGHRTSGKFQETNLGKRSRRVEEAMQEEEVVYKVERAVQRTLKATGSERPPDASITVVAKKYGQVASNVFLKNGPCDSETDQNDKMEQELEEMDLPVSLTDEQLESARFAAMVAYAHAMRHEEDPFQPDPEVVEQQMKSFHEKANAIREQYGSLSW